MLILKEALDAATVQWDREQKEFQPAEKTKADAFGTADQIQSQTLYTSTGLVWKTIDPNGNETQTDHDLAARPVKTWQPDPTTGLVHSANSPVTETIYDAASNVAATINPLGNRWDFTHDARNRQIKEESPAVVDAETSGNPSTRPTSETFLDGAGNVIATKDPRGAVTETVFDRANRPSTITTPAVPIYGVSGDIQLSSTTHYDMNSNVVKAVDYEGNAIVNYYDKLNRLSATATNPVSGQPSEIYGSPAADDIVVHNTHDDAGNLVQVTDGEGAVTGFRYDGLSRNTQTIWDEGDDLERRKTLAYDALVLTSRTDEKAQVTNYSYDDLHRLEDVVYVGRTIDNRHYTYDDNSNILTVTHPNEVNTLRDTASTWDPLNRLTGETSADVTHSYVLDKAGNRLSTTYGQTSLQIVSTYDPLNRLAILTEGTRVTTYAYNLNGSIVEKVLPNDVTVAGTFDLLGRKKSSVNTADGAAQPFAQYDYGHDKQGNLVEIDESYPLGNLTARIVTNAYDKVYRLDTETIAVSGGSTSVTDYAYDDAHNRIQKSVTTGGTTSVSSYTYGDGSTASTANSNQLVSFTEGSNTVTFTYDANGNRATRSESSQTDTYSYDYENRLLNLDYQTGSADTGLYEYGYDYRTRRTVRDESAITGRDKDLIVFSGGTSAQEHTTSISSSPDVEYIRGSDYGGGIGGVLYTLRSGTPSIKHYNSRGDVVAATDDSGSLTYQAAYEAFGKHGDTPSSEEWGSTVDRQQANTKDEDPTGLLNEGFRYRDLETGAFITRDPLGFVDGPNVYTYVVQNPWTKFDPLGLKYDDEQFDDEGYMVPREDTKENRDHNDRIAHFNKEWEKARETPTGSAMHEYIKKSDWTFSVDVAAKPTFDDEPDTPYATDDGKSKATVNFPSKKYDYAVVAHEFFHNIQAAENSAYTSNTPFTFDGNGDPSAQWQNYMERGFQRSGDALKDRTGLSVYHPSDYSSGESFKDKNPGTTWTPSNEAQSTRIENNVRLEYLKKTDPKTAAQFERFGWAEQEYRGWPIQSPMGTRK